MNDKKFITIVYFLAFNRFLKESYEDHDPPMRYTIKRRIKNLCSSAVILKIEHYEGKLIHQEILNKGEWDKFKMM